MEQWGAEQEEQLRFVLICIADRYAELNYTHCLELATELEFVGICKDVVMEAYRRLSNEMVNIFWAIIDGRETASTPTNFRETITFLLNKMEQALI